MSRDPARFVRATVRASVAYDEQAPSGVNLSNNTNLFGANPAFKRALDAAGTGDAHDYPNLRSADLQAAVASAYGVDAACVVTGNGSNDLIDLTVRAVAEQKDPVVTHPPTFGMIAHFVAAHGATPIAVPLGDAWSLDVDGVIAAQPRLVFVCSPNNPTGNAFPRAAIERLLDETDALVVVDEAYGEFVPERSFIGDVAKRDNLMVLRTLSKAHGLAALRIGYAIAPVALANELAKVRGPFRLNAVSDLAGTFALADDAYVRDVVAQVRTERERLGAALVAAGFTVYPSDANFLLTKPPVDAAALAAALARDGLHVRDFGGDLADHVRITVGPAAVTDRVVAALPAALAAARGEQNGS